MARNHDQFSQDLNCFVIMPFGGLFDRYYLNLFVPAIQAAGLRAVRADSIFSSTSIMSDIWHITRHASVVLADVSGKNSNVFYELGLAHACRKPVIIITGSLEDVPFDLKGLRVIEYNKDDENWGSVLKDKITGNLKSAISDPTIAIPTTFLESTDGTTQTSDPLSLQLRQITDEIRALRASLSPRQAKDAEPRRFMMLLERHSSLLRGAPETAQLEIFEHLLQGDVSSAIRAVQQSLGIAHVEAEEIAINIFDWMKLYSQNRP